MTAPQINLAELRDYSAEAEGVSHNVWIDAHTVLALVSAVEAAQAVAEPWEGPGNAAVGDHWVSREKLTALRAALAPFVAEEK